MKLSNKIALVTGASEGVGRELVNELVRQDVRCIAVSRNIEEAKPFESNLVISKNCDVRDVQAVTQLFAWVKQTYGTLDILINNAGIWHKTGQLETIDDDIIEDVVATDLLGTIMVTKYALPLLRAAQDDAMLVNIISKSGVVAQLGQTVYTAAKYGTKGFTDVLREDLSDTRIHILGVYQSGTNTQMFAKAGETLSTDKFIEPADLAAYIINTLTLPQKIWIKEIHADYH